MTEIGARLPVHAEDLPPDRPASTRAGASAAEVENPWRILLRLQDRHRYLRVLEPRPPLMLDLDAPMPRAEHHLLRSPAAMTRTATNFPAAQDVQDYLAHSADVTVRGGTASAVTHPLALCALGEHYVLRRIGGSSAGAAVAAAAAAAELGRTTPPDDGPPGPHSVQSPHSVPPSHSVQPGFAGLAELVGWLAGQDVAGAALADGAQDEDWPEQWRLARMLQPAPGTRAAFRVLIALLRRPASERLRHRVLPPAAALVATLGRGARAVVTLVWVGAVLGWVGTTAAMVRAGTLPGALTALISISLAGTVVLAALAATDLRSKVTSSQRNRVTA